MISIWIRAKSINVFRLQFNSGMIHQYASVLPEYIDIIERNDGGREHAENFIKEIYRKRYSAEVDVTYPYIMCLRNNEGRILSAVGFRLGTSQPFFLEQYTQSSIESTLKIDRSHIVEIGNLASAGNGASIYLYIALTAYLNALEYKYAVVTATKYLHKFFKKLGFNPKILCGANKNALGYLACQWGNYYDTEPMVMSGSINQAFERLKKLFSVKFSFFDLEIKLGKTITNGSDITYKANAIK